MESLLRNRKPKKNRHRYNVRTDISYKNKYSGGSNSEYIIYDPNEIYRTNDTQILKILFAFQNHPT